MMNKPRKYTAIPLDMLVYEYVKCGDKHGFFTAEVILMKFLPANNPDGKCYSVPVARRSALVEALKKGELCVKK